MWWNRALLVTVLASVASAANGWQQFAGFGDPSRLVIANAAFDAFGGLVVVAGPGAPADDDAIEALSFAANGTPRWRRDVAPIRNVFWPVAGSLLPDGDVVLAGNASFCECSPRGHLFTVARVDGESGDVRWQRTAPGAVGGIEITRSGDAIVNAGDSLFAIADDGTTRWSVATPDAVGRVAVDHRGDAFVFSYATLAKRAGSDGDQLWTIPVTRPANAPLHLLRSGDAVTVEGFGSDVAVTRRSGIAGGVRWRAVIPNADVGIDVAVGRPRRIVVAAPLGGLQDSGRTGVAVLRLDPRSGATIWRTEVRDADTRGGSPTVAVDRHGDVVVYADAARVITRLAGRDGLVREAIPVYPARHAVLAVARDGRVALAGEGWGSQVAGDLVVQVESHGR